jgi:hypothetical protein
VSLNRAGFAGGCSTLKEWWEAYGDFYRQEGAREEDPKIVQLWFRTEAPQSDTPARPASQGHMIERDRRQGSKPQ